MTSATRLVNAGTFCTSLFMAACGGTAKVENGEGASQEQETKDGGSVDVPAEPEPASPGEPSDAPIIDEEEPEAQPEPTPEPAASSSCEDAECNPGQRCEVRRDEPKCINNTCDDLACSDTERCERHELGGFVCTDNACQENVDCGAAQYCGASGACVEDVCVAQSRTCDGNTVLECASSGSGEEQVFSCESPAYFSSDCVTVGQDGAGCSCEDDWDCPAFTSCELAVCEGTGRAPRCTLPPVAFADIPPSIEIHWGGDSSDNDAAHDGTPERNPAPWSRFSHVLSTPVVANLDDDNGDGLFNELDFPEIVFVSYSSAADRGILRAIHGGGPDKGRDMFAVCGDLVWNADEPFDTTATDCPESGVEIPAPNSLAIGDLDYDGDPEIVYGTTNRAIRILNNLGETLYLSPEGMLEEPESPLWGMMPSIANLDYEGLAELVFGREVYALGVADTELVVDGGLPVPAGALYIEHHLIGSRSRGQHGILGPTSCVANMHSGPGQEIFAGQTLYAMPELAICAQPPCAGELRVVWDAPEANAGRRTRGDGYCAVADVWGADPDLPPGPDNPPDAAPEGILIVSGTLEIFDGETGLLKGEPIDLGLEDDTENQGGGAPNVDDFDGDGFMEIAAALRDYYVLVDLQAPTDNCPAWPSPMDRILTPGTDDNPNIVAGLARDPGGACTTTADCNAGATCNTELGSCVCLHNGWRRTSDDASSRVTSSSVFDFNGDGAAEVLYNDECDFRVFDGVNGGVLYSEPSRNRTAMENPIVVDVDNDGNAEVITALNTEEEGRCDDDGSGPITGPNGLRVWGGPLDTWVSARRIWNQFAYHVTNVTESGGIPMHEPESWGAYNGRIYNTYRSQPRSQGAAPDLQVTAVSLSSPDVECGQIGEVLEISFEITNAGDVRVGPGVEVSFYGVWDDMEADLMGPSGPLTYVIMASLEPGTSLIASVVFDGNDQDGAGLPAEVRVVVDTGGDVQADFGAERECNEDNNARSAEVAPGDPRADLSIELGEADVDCSTDVVRIDVTITNSGTTEATDLVLEIYAGDPANGGTSMAALEVADIAAGDSLTLTVDVEDFPQNRSVTFWGVIDPEDTVAECNEADNADSADNPVVCNVVLGAR
jgi:hypothetical protein